MIYWLRRPMRPLVNSPVDHPLVVIVFIEVP